MVRQTEKTMILSIIGIVIILFLLLKFGIPVLSNISAFLSGHSAEDAVLSQEKKDIYVAPPVMDPLFDATSSASIKVSGSAAKDQTVVLFVNGDEKEEVKAKDDGSFVFRSVKLKKGENLIETKATEGKSESDFSEGITVVYKTEPPKLEVSSPSDGQTFSKDDNSTKVSGKTDPNVKVTVNDFWAVIDDEGNFSYTLPLKDGENTILIVATDQAGNKTEQQRKVTYNP